jgi:hypothetical protein
MFAKLKNRRLSESRSPNSSGIKVIEADHVAIFVRNEGIYEDVNNDISI